MLIRTQINLMLVVLLALLGTSGAMLYRSQALLAQSGRDALAVKELIRDISDLRFALTETVLYREQRALVLWQRKLLSMRQHSLRVQFNLPEQNTLAAGILRETDSAELLYTELVRAPSSAAAISVDKPAERELAARVVAALLVSTQEMLDDAASIGRLNEEQSDTVLALRQSFSLVGLAVLAIFSLVLGWLLNKTVLGPMHQFQLSAELVGDGDLSHRVALDKRNELGALARAFNNMTAHLQQTVAALRRTIVEYDVSQVALQQQTEQLVEDIAARKVVEAALVQSRLDAEAANRAKSVFIANMSHECRTPLNVLLGVTQLLERTELSEQQTQHLRMISTAGESLLSALNDVLDYSRIEAGGMVLERTPFALSTVLDAVAASMSAVVGAKQLELAIAVAPDVPTRLQGDSLRLQQVLIHLTGNAIKFTERGEVLLQVTLTGDDSATDQLLFSVHDSGVGIAPDKQAEIFAPFRQGDDSATRRFGGNGLGLTISQRLVVMMGGAISVRSTPEQGSVFIVALPLAPLLLPEQIADMREPAKRLLVVDAHPVSLTALAMSCSGPDWRTDCCASGAEASPRLLQALAEGDPYDLVLADAALPDRPALEQTLRDAPSALRGQLVLMAGALTAPGPETDGHALVLLKPVTSTALVAATLASQSAPSSQDRTPVGIRLDKVRVLLVEDNPLNQFVCRGMLEQLGALVVVVGDGAQAVLALGEMATEYDLVLMDIHMPVMDGFSATRLIRTELNLPLPVVALTAGVTQYEREQCLEAGMDDFIAKPVTVERLASVIGRLTATTSTQVSSPTVAAEQAMGNAVLDLGPLLELSAQRPAQRSMLRDLVQSMAHNAGEQFEAALALWRQGDADAAARALHGLRGALGTLGAQRFARAALQLEHAFKLGSVKEIPALSNAANRALQEASDAAREWLALQEPAADGDVTGLSAATLARWLGLLEQWDMEACVLYVELRPALRTQLDALATERLETAMQSFDFATALDCVQPLGGAAVAEETPRKVHPT